jgi:hypothetical protein
MAPKVYIEDPRKISENTIKSMSSSSTNEIIHTTLPAFSTINREPTTWDGGEGERRRICVGLGPPQRRLN